MPQHKIISACLKLNFNDDIKKAALLVCDKIFEYSLLEGKKPATIAGVALFIVSMKLKQFEETSLELIGEALSS